MDSVFKENSGNTDPLPPKPKESRKRSGQSITVRSVVSWGEGDGVWLMEGQMRPRGHRMSAEKILEQRGEDWVLREGCAQSCPDSYS